MRILLIFIVTLILVGCNKTQLSKEELLNYVYDSENGVSNLSESGGVVSVVTYKPSELIVFNELKRKSTNNKDSLDQVYGSTFYFEINFSGQLPPAIHSQVSNYAFSLVDYISLVGNSGKKYSIIDYQFPRLYGISNELILLVAFDKNELSEEEELNLEIEEFGLGTGKVSHSFKMNNLKNIPALDFTTLKSV